MISLENVTIRQGSFELSGVDLQIPGGAYGILMGPTGCGKTTLLEAICGLRRIRQGRILLHGLDVSHWAASRRQIGYVPQDSVLFPTMRVDHQIEFGLHVRRVNRKIRDQRVQQLAELLNIESLLTRYPLGLSGGEKQRVALARALSFGPELLCLDEPLSAVDDSTRRRLMELLVAVHASEQVTILHVTHNAIEAQELGTVHYRFDKSGLVQI